MSSDLFLQLSGNPQAKRLVQSLGLPLPMPQPLKRARGPYEERPLDGAEVLVGGVREDAVGDALAHALIEAGAEPLVWGETAPFSGPAEAWGRPVTPVSEPGEESGLAAIVFDGTKVASVADLKALYDFFHPWIRRLGRCGRVVILGRPPEDAEEPAEAGARQALEGFTRSLAKELGRRGSTANLLRVAEGAEARLDGPLRFFLSARSAFVTAQPLTIDLRAKGPSRGPRLRPLEGKTVLVTGAARGIGAATAKIMAAEGAKLLLLDRPGDDGPLAKIADATGGEAVLVDITADDAAQAIADAAPDGVDVVVHNAGVTRDKTLANMSEDRWDLALAVNLEAIVRVTAELAEGTLNDEGRVVCLSSVSGIAGNVGQTNYSASKAGVVGYVRHLAEAMAPRGITVNAIAPGFIETRLTDAMPVMIREGARRLSALGQGGLPEDVGQAITFLSTPGSVGVTGAVLRVCGGALVGS